MKSVLQRRCLLDTCAEFCFSENDIEERLKIKKDLVTTTHLTDKEIVTEATQKCTDVHVSTAKDDKQVMELLPAMSSVVKCLYTTIARDLFKQNTGADLHL
ncbi:hypothetical protein DPMN_118069 [Dreissena polymorpha]|uniref:Uncharacterized protein n=1 Tax=Dreissena polymorpha TaxID=45954 RepID=A0A9D4GGP6_DREPO|nr:hypothetical protein DPMN_118069 [Dreissena polymorpha]